MVDQVVFPTVLPRISVICVPTGPLLGVHIREDLTKLELEQLAGRLTTTRKQRAIITLLEQAEGRRRLRQLAPLPTHEHFGLPDNGESIFTRCVNEELWAKLMFMVICEQATALQL